MTCVLCGTRFNGKSDNAAATLRELGWFVWRKGAPLAHDGVVVCPKCLDTMKTVRAAMEWDEQNLQAVAS
jgi:hypothetical protein